MDPKKYQITRPDAAQTRNVPGGKGTGRSPPTTKKGGGGGGEKKYLTGTRFYGEGRSAKGQKKIGHGLRKGGSAVV